MFGNFSSMGKLTLNTLENNHKYLSTHRGDVDTT